MTMRIILLISCVLFSLDMHAFSANRTGFIQDDKLYDMRTCQQLYMEASVLEKETQLFKTNFYTDTRSRVAGYALTVFSPAIYYIGFKAYKNVESDFKAKRAMSEIDLIRQRMAEKHCFEK